VKILLISSNPQFADALGERFTQRGRTCVVAEPELGEGEQALANLLSGFDADMVISGIGIGNVDEAAREFASLLVKVCESRHIPIVHISGSQVFDGMDGGRHREEDPALPARRRGALLWQIEELIRSMPQHLILRTGPMFSSRGDNLLTRLLAEFRHGGSIERSPHGQTCPISADDLARVVSAIIDQLSCGADCWGTYHYSSSDPVSSYQFAEIVLAVASQYLDTEALKLSLDIAPEKDTQWPGPLLNCDKIRNTFGIKQMPWRSSINSVIKQVFEGELNE